VKKFAASVVDLVFTGDVCLRVGKRCLLHDSDTARDDRLVGCRSRELTFINMRTYETQLTTY